MIVFSKREKDIVLKEGKKLDKFEKAIYRKVFQVTYSSRISIYAFFTQSN